MLNYSYLSTMKRFFFFLLLTLPLLFSAQKELTLKRKYFGKYKGEIPSYNVDTGEKIMKVGATAIYVEIGKNDISITIGKNKNHGVYSVMFKAQSYYLLDCKMDNQLATERIMVYKRGRKISRDGLFPQPLSNLKKYK